MTKSYFLFFFLDHISSSFKPTKKFFSMWTKCISWASVTLEASKARFLSDAFWLGCWIDLHSFQFLSVFEPGLQLKAVIWGGPLSYITQRERNHLCRLITVWLLLHSKPGLRKKTGMGTIIPLLIQTQWVPPPALLWKCLTDKNLTNT